MTKEELDEVLKKHNAWLAGETGGEKADLAKADLRGADLRGANLRGVNLREADLYAADLREANLQYADLCGPDLRGADLRGADIDYSCWPLWCGSLTVKIDARLAAQLMYHAMRAMQSVEGDADVAAVLADENCIRLANRFHRADECGRIEAPEKEAHNKANKNKKEDK